VDKKQLEELKRLMATAKLGASPIKSEDYISPLEQDVMKIKSLGNELPEPVTKIKGMTQKIDTKGIAPVLSGAEHMKKIQSLLKGGGKKVLGALPFAGAGMAALSGDPAMAAEELAQDAMGPAGLAYEAIRPESAGNPEEEKMLLAEDKARKAYKKSQAYRDARGISEEDADIEELQQNRKPRFSKLRSLFGE
jgi:hypothetical protein